MKCVNIGSKSILLDSEDFEELSEYKIWVSRAKREHSKDYAYIYVPRLGKTITLHRFIMDMKPGNGLVIDHINGNGLDNQKKNLRICTNKQNSRKRDGRQRNNTSGYNGVQKERNSWKAVIKVNGKNIRLGYSNDKLYLAKLYDKYAKIYHGEFATLNF